MNLEHVTKLHRYKALLMISHYTYIIVTQVGDSRRGFILNINSCWWYSYKNNGVNKRKEESGGSFSFVSMNTHLTLFEMMDRFGEKSKGNSLNSGAVEAGCTQV